MNSKRRLLLAISAFMLEVGSASRADAQSEAGTSAFIKRYAAHYNVPSELIAAFIDVEARWNPRAVSSKGAVGLMQLMPATARRFGARDPFDPEQNIAAGTRYLTTLM